MRRMPRKTATLDFTEDGYEGFTCKRWINPPMGLVRRLRESEDEDTARGLWLEIFPDWDFVDDKGKAIPHTVEGFELIPDELFTAMVSRGVAAVKEAALPRNLNGNSSAPVAEEITA